MHSCTKLHVCVYVCVEVGRGEGGGVVGGSGLHYMGGGGGGCLGEMVDCANAQES